MITREIVKALFDYEDGKLFRFGKRAGYLNDRGYRIVKVSGIAMREHRVIFLMHHGYLPDEIDHIDGDRLNNRIENLRPATRSQQCLNRVGYSDRKNITLCLITRKWLVRVGVNKKVVFRHRFEDLELAELVAYEAREKFHGKFVRHA